MAPNGTLGGLLMQAKSNISRRAVVKGVAWAVPAVAVGVAAPAYAVSPGCVTGITGSGVLTAWSLASHRDYRLTITFEIRSGCSVPINISDVRLWNAGPPTRTYPHETLSIYPSVSATLTTTTSFTIDVRSNFDWLANPIAPLWPNEADIYYTIDGVVATLKVSLTSSGQVFANSAEEATKEAKELETHRRESGGVCWP